MIPNFALSLSFEGIALLRRMGGVWASIDEVALDSDDLDSDVLALRDKALELDPRGATVLLVIPNEQIRYLDLPDLGGDEKARHAAIRAALDGATPYAVSDLTYDHAQSGGRLQIAAVANETLDEAEGFAGQHGFTPAGFVARAPDGAFDGAVFFGAAKGGRKSAERPPRALEIVPADKAALTPLPPPAAPAGLAEPTPAPQVDATPADAPETAAAPETTPEAEVVETAPDNASASEAAPAASPDLADDTASVAAPASDDIPVRSADDAHTSDAAEPHADPSDVLTAAPVATDAARNGAESRPAPADEVPETAAQPVPKGTSAPTARATATEDRPEDTADRAPVRAAPSAAPNPPKASPDTASAAPKGPPTQAAARLSARDESGDKPSASFSTVRATRGAGSVPPAPRALKLGPAATPGIKPRFTPLAVKQDAALEAKAAAERAETAAAAEAKAERPTRGGKSFLGRKDKKKEKPSKGGKPARIAPAPPTPSAAAQDPIPDMPTLARPAAAPKATAEPEAAKPLPKAAAAPKAAPPPAAAKPLPKSPQPPRAAPPQEPDRPAVAARSAAPGDGIRSTPPQEAGPNPLARLAALRNEGRRPGGTGPNPALAAAAMPAPAEAGRNFTPSADERERMTVFGERNRDRIGGKPRFLGLMLTTALLLFLAGVAAWASVFLDEGLARLFRSDEPERAIATLPETVAPEPVTATPPDPSPTAEPAASDPAPAEEPEPEIRMAALDPVPEPETPTEDPTPTLSEPVPPAVPRALTPEEAAATYAATGIWQRAPIAPLTPPADGVEEIYVASIDPSVESSDAVALPDLLNAPRETVLDSPGLPPPAGMTFDIDERGLVRATAEGAMAPQGYRIYTGLPPVVPPLRQPPEPEAPTADRLEEFRGVRPEARPDDVLEQRERATLRGISLDELAGMRPVRRPLTVQEEAEAENPDTPATEQAVEASLQPVGRPRNMPAIVQQAEETRPTEAVQTAAAVAPRTIAPKVPSSASVARAATTQNAINLRRINLIGVYGTPSNRRALVRLPSGKYQKVKVGDRLDGGRVSSIDDSELRYTKGGRSIQLEMPRG